MSEYTSAAIRQTGEIRDALGRPLVVGSDCDSVSITVPETCIVHLDARQRDEFIRLYFEAERQAEAWATEHAASVVQAEIWCGDPGECVNGPAGHLWQDSCHDLPGEAS